MEPLGVTIEILAQKNQKIEIRPRRARRRENIYGTPTMCQTLF